MRMPCVGPAAHFRSLRRALHALHAPSSSFCVTRRLGVARHVSCSRSSADNRGVERWSRSQTGAHSSRSRTQKLLARASQACSAARSERKLRGRTEHMQCASTEPRQLNVGSTGWMNGSQSDPGCADQVGSPAPGRQSAEARYDRRRRASAAQPTFADSPPSTPRRPNPRPACRARAPADHVQSGFRTSARFRISSAGGACSITRRKSTSLLPAKPGKSPAASRVLVFDAPGARGRKGRSPSPPALIITLRHILVAEAIPSFCDDSLARSQCDSRPSAAACGLQQGHRIRTRPRSSRHLHVAPPAPSTKPAARSCARRAELKSRKKLPVATLPRRLRTGTPDWP